MATKGGSGVTYTNETAVQASGLRIENPFSLKVGQVFTGFGIGCGIGIGVGRPLNLGAIPVLNQVMMATRGATDAFSGVQVHVNNSLRKMGAKNIEAGIGCGVGFGHGFGVGIAIKPSLLHQIHAHLSQAATHVMKKLGIGSTSPLSVNQSILPASIQSGMSVVKEPLHENPVGSSTRDGQTVSSSLDTPAPKSAALDPQHSSRTEAVLNNFLKNSILQEDGKSLHKQPNSQQLENDVLQMVLKHQLLIDELMQENEKLHQILVEELKVQPSKLQSSFTNRSKSTCAECFECRRKQRRR